jgi:aminoglycoside phosphotransferase (APT) family kinase protein
MTPVPREVTQEIAAQLDCSIHASEQLDGGRAAQTYLLSLDGDPETVVCKIGGPSVRTGDVIEPLVFDLVAETTDLPVPSVLASGTLTRDEDTPWAVYEFCAGDQPTPFQSLDQSVRERTVREVGSILGRLHERHAFERTGGLARAGDTLTIRDPSGADFPGKGRRVLAWVADDCCDREPVLSHGDLYPGNLLIDDEGAITGVVDWGNAHVTTAGYALARAEMRFIDWFRFPPAHRQRLTDALREGYTAHRSLPDEYPELGPFYKLLWLAQSADRIRRHVTTNRGRRRLKQHAASLLSRVLSNM